MNFRLHLVAAIPLVGVHAFAQDVSLVSVDSSGIQADGPSYRPALSADGRFVAFESDSTNLAGDGNGLTDVFLRDRTSGTTTLVTLTSTGVQAVFGGSVPAISADGRFVAFESDSPDLVPNDVNGWTDVFVRDMQSNTTECVSIDASGNQGNHVSRAPSISSDGRFVAFESRAATLVPNDTNFTYDVFVHDRQTGTTERVSVDSSGAQGDSISRAPSISGDGRFVAFESFASNLVAGDTNGLADVFVHDRQSGTTIRVSVSSAGTEGDLQSINPAFSRDGRFVAFESEATNLVGGDVNGNFDVYVRDLVAGTTARGSVGTNGSGGAGDSFQPALSADGRYLAFESYVTFDADDANVDEDVWVHDFQLGTTTRASLSTEGRQVNGTSSFAAIDDDGGLVAFTSLAPDVVPADSNAGEDVFVSEHAAAFESLCIGDGSGAACPCGNDSAIGSRAGCAHSGGDGGRLAVHGNPSIANDTLVLSGISMTNGSALYFQGQTALALGLGVSFGDGLRCAGGTILRLGIKLNAGGVSQYPAGTDAPVSVRGACTSGSTRVYQVWYRNAAAFCTSATYNLTNGLRLTWAP